MLEKELKISFRLQIPDLELSQNKGTLFTNCCYSLLCVTYVTQNCHMLRRPQQMALNPSFATTSTTTTFHEAETLITRSNGLLGRYCEEIVVSTTA